MMKQKQIPNCKIQLSVKGFTLIELAVVLVVMGLLIIGAMAGKDLYRASQIRGVIAQIQETKIAVENFRTQYEGLPGDLKNATDFWPGDDTVNGDDNGRIDTDAEIYSAWQHLVLGKMIAGHYSGTGTDAQININVPKTKHMNGGMQLLWVEAPGEWQDNQGKYFSYNYLLLGKDAAVTDGSDYLTSAMFIPEDAYAIDIKLDNDQPDYGSVLAADGDGISNCEDAGSYLFTTTVAACILYIRID